MWGFLDRRGWPIEWVKGRPFYNILRTLLYCRRITMRRPEGAFPCWTCHNCLHEEAYIYPQDWVDCPKCETGVMFIVQHSFKILFPGVTRVARRDNIISRASPPFLKDPEIIQLFQCLRAAEGWITEGECVKESDYGWSLALECVRGLRAERDNLHKALKICELTARGWPPTDEEAYEGDRLAAFDAIEDLANSREALAGTLDLFRRAASGLRSILLIGIPCTCPPGEEWDPECPLLRAEKLFNDFTRKIGVTKAEQTNPPGANHTATQPREPGPGDTDDAK